MREEQDILTFGDILRRLRLDAGWKQSEVASRLGRHEATVSRIEKNETLPKRSTVETYLGIGLQLSDKALANYLQIYDEMATGSHRPESSMQVAIRSEAYITCLKRAEMIARNYGSTLVGTPHLFLALYQNDLFQVRRFFSATGIDLHATAQKVRKIIRRKTEGAIRHIGNTLEALRAKEMAEEMACAEQTAVSYKHLWFALLSQEHSLLVQILEGSGHQPTTLKSAL